MRRRLLVAAVLALMLVGVGGARTGATAGGALLAPQTLVRVPGEMIAGFAQDGDRIAWSSFGAACPVYVLRLSTRVRTALPSRREAKSCREFGGASAAFTPFALAFAGTRALWAAFSQSNTETDGYFITAALDDPVARSVCGFGEVGGSEDNYTPTLATAGDGRTLAFAMSGYAGMFGRVCSGIWRVDTLGHARRITATPSTVFAVGGSRIGVAQTTDNGARSTVDLYGAGSGRRIGTAAAAGRAQAIALSRSTLAVLVDGRFGRRIELFGARSFVSRGSVTVPAATAAELSAAGAKVVYRVGKKIFLLDGPRRAIRILAVAKSTPIGLSIEGRRVAWAENPTSRNGRVRALVLARQ